MKLRCNCKSSHNVVLRRNRSRLGRPHAFPERHRVRYPERRCNYTEGRNCREKDVSEFETFAYFETNTGGYIVVLYDRVRRPKFV